MGRPPLGMVATQIRLPQNVRDRITAIVGVKGMAAFVREAIERELVRREEEVRVAGRVRV